MNLTLVYISIIIFNFIGLFGAYMPIDFFGETWGFFKQDGFSDEILDSSRLFIWLSILAMLTGTLYAWIKSRNKINNSMIIEYDLMQMYAWGYICTLLSAVAMAVIILKGVDYAGYNEGLVQFERLFINFGISGMSFFAATKKIPKIVILYGLLTSAFVYKTGARAEGMIQLLPIFAFYNEKIASKKWVLFPLLLVAFFYAASITRDIRGGYAADLNIEHVILTTIIETGFTSNITPMTFELLRDREYTLGLNYIGAIFAVIPKLAFWMAHEEYSYALSSALGFYYDAGLATSGKGLGGSAVAETYFAFGWFGIVLCFAYGYVIYKLLSKANKSPFGNYIKYAVFGILLIGIRQDSIYVFRMIAWFGVLPYFAYYLSKNKI